jgi:hypothetical protein
MRGHDGANNPSQCTTRHFELKADERMRLGSEVSGPLTDHIDSPEFESAGDEICVDPDRNQDEFNDSQ